MAFPWAAAASFVGNLIGGERRNEAQANTAEDVNEFNAEQAAIDREFQSREAAVSRKFNREEALRNRRFQRNSASRAMNYDRDMSNTAVRRRMRDLRLAGINPILAGRYDASTPSASALSGSTASSHAPSGATASGVQATVEDSLGAATSSAKDAYTRRHQAALLKEETKREIEATAQARANTSAIKAAEGRTKAETENVRQNTRIGKATEEKVWEEINGVRASTAHNIASAIESEERTRGYVHQRGLHSAQAQRESAAALREGAQTDDIRQQIRHRGYHEPALKTMHDIDMSAYARAIAWASRLGAGSSSALSAIGALSAARGLGSAFARSMKRK